MEVMPKTLSYDEQKAAEAAFNNEACDGKWSDSAKRIYRGISEVMLHRH